MKAKYQRLWIIILSVVSITAGLLIFLNHFKDNLVFFYTPTQCIEKQIPQQKLIRVGGMVKKGSLVKNENGLIDFILTDNQNEFHINYNGMLPSLFREGQGVVAQGIFIKDKIFLAENLLAKHDEKYMPPELVKSLKQQGQWHQ